MLLGYNENTGIIEFLFTDDAYLEKQFPDNSAKVSNFWKNDDHGLKELFVSKNDFSDYGNYKFYKVEQGKVVKFSDEKIKIILDESKTRIPVSTQQTNDNFLSVDKVKIKALEDKIKDLEEQLKEKRLDGGS